MEGESESLHELTDHIRAQTDVAPLELLARAVSQQCSDETASGIFTSYNLRSVLMRPIGFSTGALAKGDFRRGLALQDRDGVDAIELSALRDHELETLSEAVPRLDLSRFQYVSFHAPSKLKVLREEQLVESLRRLPASWPIIVHPDIIKDSRLWKELGSRLCLENMDHRKPTGRTVEEMRSVFDVFPDASFCLDVGHARQIDRARGGCR